MSAEINTPKLKSVAFVYRVWRLGTRLTQRRQNLKGWMIFV
jgi:hypothetical protein